MVQVEGAYRANPGAFNDDEPSGRLRIDYLKPAVGDAVIGVAKVRRRGRSACVVDIDVTNEEGVLVAIGRGTYVPITA